MIISETSFRCFLYNKQKDFAKFREKDLWSSPFKVKLYAYSLYLYLIKAQSQLISCKFCEICQNRTSAKSWDWSIIYSSFFLVQSNNGQSTLTNGRNLLQVSVTMLTIKTPERRHWYRSGAFIVISEYVSLIVLVFPLLTLNK